MVVLQKPLQPILHSALVLQLLRLCLCRGLFLRPFHAPLFTPLLLGLLLLYCCTALPLSPSPRPLEQHHTADQLLAARTESP